MPKSTTQLRALNWAKLPESRVAQTVFAALDESPLYRTLDLEDIDKTFDASSSKRGIEVRNGCGQREFNKFYFLKIFWILLALFFFSASFVKVNDKKFKFEFLR